MGFLTLLRNPKIIGVVLIVVALAGVGTWIQSIRLENAELAKTVAQKETTITSLNRDILDAEQVNQQNLVTLEQLRFDDAQRKATIAQLETDLAEAKGKTEYVYVNIENATAAEDGPIAPVLASTILSLQKLDDVSVPLVDEGNRDEK